MLQKCKFEARLSRRLALLPLIEVVLHKSLSIMDDSIFFVPSHCLFVRKMHQRFISIATDVVSAVYHFTAYNTMQYAKHFVAYVHHVIILDNNMSFRFD